MTAVLVIAEHANGKLNASTAKSVKAAASLAGAEITVAVFTAGGSPVPALAAQIAGVARVLEVTHAANEHQLAATLAPQVAAIAADFALVFAPSTTFGKDLMPRAAACLSASVHSNVNTTRPRRPPCSSCRCPSSARLMGSRTATRGTSVPSR